MRIPCINNNRGQVRKSRESIISNARYGIGDSYRGQARTPLESPDPYARYRIGDSHRAQARATIESIVSNTRDRIGDYNGSQARAIIESVVSKSRNSIRITILINRFGNAYAACYPGILGNRCRMGSMVQIVFDAANGDLVA